MQNFTLTELEKHNLEVMIKNVTNQIMHLETLIEVHTGKPNISASSQLTLTQLNNAQRTLDNLTPHVSEWVDQDADVQRVA